MLEVNRDQFKLSCTASAMIRYDDEKNQELLLHVFLVLRVQVSGGGKHGQPVHSGIGRRQAVVRVHGPQAEAARLQAHPAGAATAGPGRVLCPGRLAAGALPRPLPQPYHTTTATTRRTWTHTRMHTHAHMHARDYATSTGSPTLMCFCEVSAPHFEGIVRRQRVKPPRLLARYCWLMGVCWAELSHESHNVAACFWKPVLGGECTIYHLGRQTVLQPGTVFLVLPGRRLLRSKLQQQQPAQTVVLATGRRARDCPPCPPRKTQQWIRRPLLNKVCPGQVHPGQVAAKRSSPTLPPAEAAVAAARATGNG